MCQRRAAKQMSGGQGKDEGGKGKRKGSHHRGHGEHGEKGLRRVSTGICVAMCREFCRKFVAGSGVGQWLTHPLALPGVLSLHTSRLVAPSATRRSLSTISFRSRCSVRRLASGHRVARSRMCVSSRSGRERGAAGYDLRFLTSARPALSATRRTVAGSGMVAIQASLLPAGLVPQPAIVRPSAETPKAWLSVQPVRSRP